MPKVAFAWQLAAYIAINDWFVWLCSNVQIVQTENFFFPFTKALTTQERLVGLLTKFESAYQ